MSAGKLPYEVRKGSNAINPNPVETVKIPLSAHDKLLAKIDAQLREFLPLGTRSVPITVDWFLFALREVVELHKPRKAYFGDDEFVCRACGSADIEWTYPCPTIQAIEEKLK
jgi:hypothetical protein